MNGRSNVGENEKATLSEDLNVRHSVDTWGADVRFKLNEDHTSNPFLPPSSLSLII